MVAPQPPPATQPDPVIFERLTQGGRKLFYRLEVIQQPERARACGSGPKSSADRRPVDPPPVVELRIFEGGPTLESSKDITFLYNANFFLFATLEHARVTAHCRGQAQTANTPPVLTGMPVSGMAYLDRPKEAGYFLFPDLSVRHEGRYRLMFNLYEQTKEMADRDAVPQDSDEKATEEFFDWRMEIKSDDFTVFSAKKFPGLAESTTLSRTVAEQGCRVRIRRDVRMRRRDPKHGGGGTENYENGEGEYRRRRTKTPEAERHRSISHESAQRTPYSAQDARRMSGHSVADYPPPPPSYRGSQPAGGHLSFGSQTAPQYAPPPFPIATNSHPPSVPASPSFGPSHAGHYPHQAPYPSPVQSHPYSDRPPTSHYGPSMNPSPKSETYPHDYRRPSSIYPRPSPRNSISDGPIEPDPNLTDECYILPPMDRNTSRAPPPLRPVIEPQSHYSPAPTSGKRSYDDHTEHAWLPDYSQKNGARSQNPLYHESYMDMSYKRAAGHMQDSLNRGFLDLTKDHGTSHIRPWEPLA